MSSFRSISPEVGCAGASIFSLGLLSLLLACGLPLFASQTPVPPSGSSPPGQAASTVPGAKPLEVPSKYAKEPFVVLDNSTVVTFAADGTGTRDVKVAIRVQSDSARSQLGLITFRYESDSQQLKILYVRVRKPDGSVVPTTTFLDMPAEVSRIAPLYSDLKEKQVPVKGLNVGDTLEYHVLYTTTKPQVPGQFWFAYNFAKTGVYLKESLKIKTPASVPVKLDSLDVKPSVSESGGQKIYSWETAQLKPTKPPNPEKARSTKPKPPSVQITSFKNWQQIGAWYRGLQEAQIKVTPAIQAKAADLTKGDTTRQQKIEAIYKYVSTQFRYIGLDFGIGRYKPHTAEEVLSNGYGDCKDKHTLLATLLKAEGIDGWPALISSNLKLDPGMPSPAQFDHVITVIPENGTYLWLDSTPEISPFGYLFVNLRGKTALVIPDQGPAKLVKTPEQGPFPESVLFTAKARLDASGNLTGHLTMSLRGDSGVIMRALFHRVAAVNWQRLAQTISYGYGFAGDVTNVTGSDPTDTTGPFHYSWDYSRKDYSDWSHLRISPPLPSFHFPYTEQDPKPVDPIQLAQEGEKTFQASVELPKGYSIDLPQSVNIQFDFAEYHSQYSFKDGIYHAERRLVIKKSKVPTSKWTDYLKLVKAVFGDQDNTAQLITPGDKNATAPVAQISPAENLIRQASPLIASRKLAAAEKLLKQAEALDPDAEHLYFTLGYLYTMEGQRDRAIRAFQKAVQNHPGTGSGYFALADLRILRHDPKGAIDALHKELRVSPGNPRAEAVLARLLVQTNQPKAALPLLASLKVEMPGDLPLQVLYGGALIKTGQQKEGVATLQKVAGGSPTPSILNDVAMELADNSSDLSQAQSYARRAVAAAENDTNDLTMDPDHENSRKRAMYRLAAYWDTLGWVDVHIGDFAEAERYLESAWLLSQNPDMAAHLGVLFEKQGNKRRAAHYYRLSIASNTTNFGGNGNVDVARGHLRKLGFPPTGGWPGPGAELTTLRTVHIPGKKGISGSADVYLLFTAGKLQDLRFTSGAKTMYAYRAEAMKAKYDVPFPDTGTEKVVRHGMLFCTADQHCDLTLLVP